MPPRLYSMKSISLNRFRKKLTRDRVASGMSEAEAIDHAKQGDGECFEFLYKLHKRRVYSVCLRMIGDVGAAEDLTREATYLNSMRMVGMLRDPHKTI